MTQLEHDMSEQKIQCKYEYLIESLNLGYNKIMKLGHHSEKHEMKYMKSDKYCTRTCHWNELLYLIT